MNLIKLTSEEFTNFVNDNSNGSYFQSIEYARFLEELDYDCDFIGLKDNYNTIHAASLIAFKKINNIYSYAYAPSGFLIDYNDIELLKDFAKSLNKLYKERKLLFIKINPNIIISRLNKKTMKFDYNNKQNIKNNLRKAKYQELKNNQYFESVLPKYNPIVNLKTFAFKSLNKNVRNKISKSYRKGLSIEKVGYEGIETLYPLIKNKSHKTITYYQALFHSFEPKKKIDIFLVSIDFNEYLINMKDEYQKELDKNNKLIKLVANKPNEKALDLKMQSDKLLLSIKNSIVEATMGLRNNPKIYIAGGIVIKYKNTVNIFESGYDIKYKDCNANYFLHYKIMEYYKYNYDYLDLNGFSGNLDYGSTYSGLNNFKLGFKSDVYEKVGEYDIVYHPFIYHQYIKNGKLANIFKN